LEFCNRDFDELCKTHGIVRHRIVRNTSQQNGVVERMNRTLLEKVRCLLFTIGMPKIFWGDTLSTVAHLMNRSASIIINFKCPEEKWTGRRLNLDYLKMFGCEAYAHKLEGKLDPMAINCVFVGY